MVHMSGSSLQFIGGVVPGKVVRVHEDRGFGRRGDVVLEQVWEIDLHLQISRGERLGFVLEHDGVKVEVSPSSSM